jgi:hypothetical protein
MGRAHKRSQNNAPELGANAFLIKGMMQMLQEQIKASEPKVRRKRKPSQYNIFMSEEMARLKAQYSSKLNSGEMGHKDIFKLAALAWKDCNESCKSNIATGSAFSKIKAANKLMKKAHEIQQETKTRSPKTRSRGKASRR